ncbi:MAG: radical SAM protein [Fibrobacteria bacterium]|nr:radical SAM protein [Fibrobacteria bacterium]
MNILLILPSDSTYRYGGFFRRSLSYAPLTLTTLAALVPPELNARVDMIDEGVQRSEYADIRYDVVGITCVASSAPRAYSLCRQFKKKGALTVLGGIHVTLNPDEASKVADVVVSGPADDVWPALLRSVHKQEPLQKKYYGSFSGQLSKPLPRRDLLPAARYLRIPTIMASQGCLNHCSFCSIQQVYKGAKYTRPVADVIDEIRILGKRRILFLDPHLTADTEYARELFEALIPLNIRWAGLATSEIAFQEPIFSLMVKSGCEGLLVGFESASQASLNGANKGFHQTDRFAEAMHRFHQHKILILGCFVLGFDEDQRETLMELPDLVDYWKMDLPRFAVLTPFPGTPLYEKFTQEERIINYDLRYYDCEHVVFKPHYFSPEQLRQAYIDINQQTFKLKRIMNRSLRARRSSLLTFASNLGFRRLSSTIDKRHQSLVSGTTVK